MPPDALQPKAYCTNPGLYSFLLAPPGVSTRDPSSERRNYLGEKWPVISTESCDFHTNMRHGTNGFTSLPKEGVLRICSPWKIRRLPPGLNPRTWVPKARTLPLDHRSRLLYFVSDYSLNFRQQQIVFTNLLNTDISLKCQHTDTILHVHYEV